MAFYLEIIPRQLSFKFDARTSRGAMQQHQVYYLKLTDSSEPGRSGLGECAPLPGLSPEHHPDFPKQLQAKVKDINFHLQNHPGTSFESVIYDGGLQVFPSLVFALETAWLDWQQQGSRILYPGPFTSGQLGIPINGLVWMGDQDFMQEQIRRKLQQGYRCLKLKIGGLDFETELAILAAVRKTAGPGELSIRLDANGAFAPNQALDRLQQLAVYDIHSIEQPIRQGQVAAMASLVSQSPIPIVLDEELIGIARKEDKAALLAAIAPPYIILKPTLVGGLAAAREWISLAEARGLGWWITSALESNIGLNAISQFTAIYPLPIPQGLGTGQLYHNNIASPLTIREDQLYYDPAIAWGEI
ncbi:MAG: o-succinylbenzoate synthase [Adhaeribacter sp.]